MAISTGSSPATINVTPMIDVLLVLLIIFMVITPLQSVGLDTRVPQPSTDDHSARPSTAVVIQVRSDQSVWINQRPVEPGQLGPRLREVAALRPNGVVFLQVAKGLEFLTVANVIDEARGAGLRQVALMTEF